MVILTSCRLYCSFFYFSQMVPSRVYSYLFDFISINNLWKYVQYLCKALSHAFNARGPQGFWGSVEKGYLFSGSCGALLIIIGELGSKHILLGI